MIMDNNVPSSPPLPPELKRSRASYDEALPSSDPPVFSSDDIDPSSEQYFGLRPKRQIRGPWWEHGQRKRRQLTKNNDSGIYLNSDDSDGLLPEIPITQPGPGSHAFAFRAALSTSSKPTLRRPERLVKAAKIVTDCVETGYETIDLSNLLLDSLPEEISRLKQMIRNPKFSEYSMLVPQLRLILSGNRLTSFPAQLLDLTNLTTLSLRNCGLESVPGAIGRLKNLTELNLASNKLRYFPHSLLALRAHSSAPMQLSLRPNPLIIAEVIISKPGEGGLEAVKGIPESDGAEPDDRETILLHDEEVRYWSREKVYSAAEGQPLPPVAPSMPRSPQYRYLFTHIASTPITFFNEHGVPITSTSNPPPPSTTPTEKKTVLAHRGNHAWSIPSSIVESTNSKNSPPSLFSLALQTCANIPYLAEITYLAKSECSAPVSAALTQSVESQAEGGRTCSVCEADYLIVRAEWLEFWYHMHSSFVPFLRRTCSWQCAVKARREMWPNPSGNNTKKRESRLLGGPADGQLFSTRPAFAP